MTRITEAQIEQAAETLAAAQEERDAQNEPSAVDKLFAESMPLAEELRPWRLEVAKAEVRRFVEIREALREARGLS